MVIMSMHMYIHIYMYMCIYISIYVQEHGGQGTGTPDWGDNPVPGGTFFDFGGLLTKETDRSSAPCDGPSWAASNTAIESFWRCIFVEIRPFLSSIRAPWRSLGSQGRPWGVPEASPGVPGSCPGDPRDARDAFRKDDSVI